MPDSRRLLRWFDSRRRDLPWRRTKDPYAIWISEIMLQQTQVATVVPYWERWMDRFPTVEALAAADEQDALSVWQGLGYYRRCRYLHRGAQWVVEHGMPNGYEGWLKVPGVGRYTAAAIASIAFDEAVPLVDGNVERVYARVCLDRSTGPALHRNAWKWASEVLDERRPGDWNQALMELGATICRPGKPDCPNCPILDSCEAYQAGEAHLVPVAAPKRETVSLKREVWIPYCEGRFGVRQIPEGEWWQGMWQFPQSPFSPAGGRGAGFRHLGQLRHAVTHHRITLDVFLQRCELPLPELAWHTPDGLERLPMPTPQRRCLALAIEALRSPILPIE